MTMRSDALHHRRDNPLTSSAEESPRVSTSMAWPIILLFASGFSALVFQVIWIRQLSTVVGVDVYAVTIGVSAFMAGLSLGSMILGRLADRLRSPLSTYAVLEFAVAVLGIAVTFVLPRTAATFAVLESTYPILAWPMVLALVAIPAFVMGGTLPACMRSLSSDARHVGSQGGRLYAANTAGAIAGTLLASFLLLPNLGISGSAFAAAGISLLAAVVAWGLARSNPSKQTVPAQAAAKAPFSTDARLAIGLYAMAGGIALGYEVVWTQSIVQFMSTRTFAFSVVLATYLLGIALGAALASRWIDRVSNVWTLFGSLIAAAGLVALIEVAVLGPWIVMAQSVAEYWVLKLTQNQLAGMCARFATASFSIVFLPTLLLGAAFPAVLKLAVPDGGVGRGVGAVSAWNTLGGIAGTAITGFVLIPAFGFVRTLGILAASAGIIGLIAVFRDRPFPRLAAISALVILGASAATVALVPADRFAALLPGAQKGKLVFYEEGLGATVAVVEQGNSKSFRRLYIQGVSNTGDSLPSRRYMRLQALLPLIIQNKQPKSALVIGLGTGITAGALLAYDGLEHRVAAELLPGVRRATSLFQGNNNAAIDQRLDIRLRDGRRELLASADNYDLITLEPPPPSAAGVANLYSTDFYKLAAARLSEGGMVAQWLPLPTQNVEDSRALVKSFIEVFPYASLWTTELHEMMLVGSMQPMTLNLQKMQQRFDQPGIRQTLSEAGITSLSELMATWVTGRAGLEAFAAEIAPVTDDRPSIEYAAWVRPDTFTAILPQLMGLAREPSIEGATPDFLSALGRDRGTLYTFYAAGLSAYRGDREAWQTNASEVMRRTPDNAYYTWFFGGDQQ